MGDLFTFDRLRWHSPASPSSMKSTHSCQTGKLTVIAGVSGAGKSSLLRLCNRLEVPTGGYGAVPGHRSDGDGPLAGCGAGSAWYSSAPPSSRERSATTCWSPTAAPPRRHSQEVMATAELDPGLLDRTGDDLSGGEAQRACLARTLICRPEVLLMDESTASLHPAAILALEATVLELCRVQSLDVIWVTHDLAQIDRLAEHLLVLVTGTAIYNGAPGTEAAKLALDTLTAEEDH